MQSRTPYSPSEGTLKFLSSDRPRRIRRRKSSYPSTPSTSTAVPATERELGIGKGGQCQFKCSQKCHADLIEGETDAPPPLKKRIVSSTASAEKGEESVHAPCK